MGRHKFSLRSVDLGNLTVNEAPKGDKIRSPNSINRILQPQYPVSNDIRLQPFLIPTLTSFSSLADIVYKLVYIRTSTAEIV